MLLLRNTFSLRAFYGVTVKGLPHGYTQSCSGLTIILTFTTLKMTGASYLGTAKAVLNKISM